MLDSSILWGASPAGISVKLPTREGRLNQGQAIDTLETISGLVLARVGSVGDIPTPLLSLASKVVETGAAALIEISDFPEQSTDTNSLGQILWKQYNSLLEALVAGVEALGGEPDVMKSPLYNFPPPAMYGDKLF
jgi:hypothetical protein